MSRVLFATSNGTGLGHLNRAMSIARRLPADLEPSFFTLSQAVGAVVGAGFRAEYFPGYRRPGSGSDWQWNMRLRHRFEMLLADERPDLVVFDGVHPYRAVTHVLSAPGAPPSVWSRRPLWRAGTQDAALQRTGAFDLVLEPGELAGERDRGPTVARRDEVVAVEPIVYLDESELLDRADAAAELGLDPGRPTALVNLGQGGATDAAVARVLHRLSGSGELQVAALASSIGAGLRVPEGTVRLSATFPVSRYLRAFDFAIAAAGYNAFHELLAFAVPTLFVPMPRNTDDQAARAAWAATEGAAIAVEGPEAAGLEEALGELLDPARRVRLADRCRELARPNGAVAAAQLVAALASGAPPQPAVRDSSRMRRWLHSSSHPVGPSLPLALALTARDLLGHPERRKPRGVILALEVDPESFEHELSAAIDSLAVDRGRVLVITDSLDFAAMRRLGVGIQRLPSPAEVGMQSSDPAYDELVDRRVELALSPWRGRWPIRRIGGAEGEADHA